MKYSRFEWLTLTIGALAVLGTLLASMRGTVVPQEVVAQLLLIAVLVGAVHWGRNGGFIAAVAAVSLYVLLRVPTITAEGMTADLFAIIMVRVATYGIVGILGGEVCGRIKYVFAGLESRDTIDEVTQVYNQQFIAKLLVSHVAQHTRYGSEFSVAVLTIPPALLAELRPSKQRSILRGAANLVRNDVRMVDEVGRLDDGRFAVILPHTPRAGANIAAERVRKGLRDYLGARDESVTAQVLSMPEDIKAMYEIAGEEAPPSAAELLQASGL